MSLADRCDEVTRLIDEALRDVQRVEPGVGAGADVDPELLAAPDAVHTVDGRWWQRAGAAEGDATGHAAA